MGEADYEIFYAIADIRYDFIVYWHDQKLNETYPFTMFQLMNESYELGFWDAYHSWALLRWNEKAFKDWQKNRTENVIDFTNYNLKAEEPKDMTRKWSLMGEINQKQSRPQDKPKAIDKISPEGLALIKKYYPYLLVD